jgi:hypothetical protein
MNLWKFGAETLTNMYVKLSSCGAYGGGEKVAQGVGGKT